MTEPRAGSPGIAAGGAVAELARVRRAQDRDELRAMAEEGLIAPESLDAHLAAWDRFDYVRVAQAVVAGLPGYQVDAPFDLAQAPRSATQAWDLPAYLRAGDDSLERVDFISARPAGLLVFLEIGPTTALDLRLPAGWGVNLDMLDGACLRLIVNLPQEPAPGRPLLVVYGELVSGAVEISEVDSEWWSWDD